jgi:hypothetical protein
MPPDIVRAPEEELVTPATKLEVTLPNIVVVPVVELIKADEAEADPPKILPVTETEPEMVEILTAVELVEFDPPVTFPVIVTEPPPILYTAKEPLPVVARQFPIITTAPEDWFRTL